MPAKRWAFIGNPEPDKTKLKPGFKCLKYKTSDTNNKQKTWYQAYYITEGTLHPTHSIRKMKETIETHPEFLLWA